MVESDRLEKATLPNGKTFYAKYKKYNLAEMHYRTT